MSKAILLVTLLSAPFLGVYAQSTKDTATHPYWIKMMQDPGINFYKTQRAFDLYWNQRPVEKGSGWKAFKRWEWLSSKLIDSLGNFPDAVLQYQDHMQRIETDQLFWDIALPGLGAGSVACRTQGDWKPMGPTQIPVNNTGQINGMGRINSIALHPSDTNVIFVGSAAGGIWKTINGGQTWSVNTDSLPTLGVSAIAIHPNNPSVMYFGSGDRDASDAAGFGVFKSTNGGGSWTISNTGMGSRTVGKLIIDPANPNVLLAACNGGIYRSANAGANWTQTYSGGFFKDIIFKPDNSKVVYATNAGLLYRSLDNGINWSNISNGLPTTAVSRAVIEVNALDPSMVYFWIANGSVHKGMYLSRDSGTSFRTQSTTPNLHDYSTTGSGTGGQAWYDMDMVSDPANQAILYCGGVNVFKSSDTGRTWTIAGYWVNQIHADQHELVASPVTNRIFAGNDGGLYASRNRGNSWTPLKSGLAIAQIYKMDASRTVKNILINGYQDNGTANYNDGWYTTRGGDGMDCEIDQTDARYSYGELYYGNIFRVFNVNMQATIAQQGYIAAGSDTINESGGWVTPITLKEGSGNTMYIGYKNIWRSNNIRSNPVVWKKISNNLGGTNASNFTETESCIANSDIFYASRSNGTLFRSDNVNATSPTWNTLTQPVSGVVNAIETDPTNPNIVYIGIGARVYRSVNKGSSWTQVASNLSYNVGAVLLDTSNRKKGIYVGTMGGGVWYTDTTLSTWRYFSKGLPNTVRVTDLEMYYEPNKECNCNVLYGSTYNRGNWYSTIYNDGSSKPVALLDPYDTVICKSNTLTFKEKSCNTPSRFKWAFSPAGASFVNGSDSMTANPSVNFSTAGKYTFRFMAENCNGTDTLEGFVIVGDSVRSSCVPSTTNNFNGLGIYSVSMAGISRVSGGRTQEGPYVNMACSKVFRVKRGQKYVLRVGTGALNNEQVKAFIDFNNNGNLSDAGELVYQPAAALASHLDTVRIPMSATAGTMLRMRIRSDFNSLGTNPCSNLSYGQTEDYGIYIEADNLIPRFVSDKSSVCQGRSVRFTDSSQPAGTSYSWNFGSGATPASASGKGPYQVKYNSPGYKTVSLTVDGKLYTKDSAVLVNASADLSISITKGDSSLCRLRPFTLFANDLYNAGAIYQWRLNNTAISDSVFSHYRISAAAFSDSGLYSVIANTAQCADTAFRRIYVRPLPVSGFSINDSDQCLRANAFVFTNSSSIGSGTYRNQWRLSDAGRDSSTSLNYSFLNHGTYTVKLISTSNFNCKDSIVKSVYVFEHPQALFSTSPTAQCFRSNLFAFTNISTIGNGTYTSAWDFGDGSSSGLSSPPSKSYAVYDTAYSIKLLLISNRGCRDSALKKIRLYAQPSASFAINDSDQCLRNNSFLFTGTGSISNGTVSSAWTFGDGGVSVLNNPVRTYNAGGDYIVRLVLNSNNSCRDTAERSVHVFYQPKAAFSINDSTQCLKNNLMLLGNNSSIGAGSFNSSWLFGDSGSANTLNASHSYSKDSVFSIRLLLVSDKLCRDSVLKPVRIYPQSKPSFSVNQVSQCFKGNAFIFTNQSVLKSGTYASNWRFGDGSNSGLQTPPGKSYTVFTDSLQVLLINTTNFSCIDTARKTIYLKASPYTNFSINDSLQCFKGNSFQFTENSSTDKGIPDYSWNFGDGNSSVLLNPVHMYQNPGTYTVKLLNKAHPSCSDSMVKSITVYPTPVASFSVNDDAQCLRGNQFVLNDNSVLSNGTYTVSWTMGDATSAIGGNVVHQYLAKGVYPIRMVAVSDKLCKDTAVRIASVFETPKADFGINDTAQCLSGNNFTFTDLSISTPSYQRKWYLPAISASVAGTVQIAYTDTGRYTTELRIVTSEGCRDSIRKAVYAAPMPDFTVIGKRKVCINDNATLLAQSNSNLQYFWRSNGGPAIQVNPYPVNTAASGVQNIEVLAVNEHACSTLLNLPSRVYVNPLPTVGFSASSRPNPPALELLFTDNGTYPVQKRNWYFYNATEGADSGSQQQEVLQLGDSATYFVRLTVTDTNGCTGSSEKSIFFQLQNTYFIPSAFTPNRDGHNEEFKMTGLLKHLKSYRMRVYGRWGELLFESDDPDKGWNGSFDGETVPTGYYLYIFELEDVNGDFKEEKGMFLLIR